MKRLEDMTEPELGDLLRAMARNIVHVAQTLDVEKHFALLLFNDPKVGQYIANCERADVIKALRETADRLEGRQTVERESFGATGEFPDGSIHEDDQGELSFGVAADSMNQRIIVNFGKPVAWVGMKASHARQLADVLTRKANQLDGGIGA